MYQPTADDFRTLESNIKDVVDLDQGCVVHTLPGAAQRVAAVLDLYSASRSVKVLTIAGDDTVLVLEYSVEPEGTSGTSEEARPLVEIFAHYLTEPLTALETVGRLTTEVVDISASILGLRTLTGAAQLVASALDELGDEFLPRFAGTIAGDDVVLIMLQAPVAKPSAIASRIRLLQAGPDL